MSSTASATCAPIASRPAGNAAARRCQLLFQVKLPLAMPVVMLGLNQTIMAALSMVVIAAMVGTKDLGQQVYIALGKANAGLGLTSGLAIALVAMMADRIIRGWAARQQARETAGLAR